MAIQFFCHDDIHPDHTGENKKTVTLFSAERLSLLAAVATASYDITANMNVIICQSAIL